MSDSITLLSGFDDEVRIDGRIGLLFECAPDAVKKRYSSSAVHYLHELVGDYEAVKQSAFDLSQKLLRDEPLLRGLPQVTICDELVMRDLQILTHTKNLHDWITTHGVKKVFFPAPSRFADGLKWFSDYLGSGLSIDAPLSSDGWMLSSLCRSLKRIQSGKCAFEVVSNELRQIINRIDPYHRRQILKRNQHSKSGQIWFYSTALTFTQIGLTYEPYFPMPFNYLIENPYTGGIPLSNVGRRFFSPYDYSEIKFAPTADEVKNAQNAISKHITSVSLTTHEASIRDAYLECMGYNVFKYRLLPQGLYQTRLFERFVEITEPKAVVVGNPVFEGYVLQAARKAGIPTFLLQHGILGDYCQFLDLPVDHYIVRGSFWQEFLAETPRQRSIVLNPPYADTNKPNVHSYENPVVLFLATPIANTSMTGGSSELKDILSELLKICQLKNIELVVRVHPLEKVGAYEKIVNTLLSSKRTQVKVTYSQGSGLEKLLSRSLVALTSASTVFLDCIRKQVPVVSFGWYDFSYKRQLEKYCVFHFCKDLIELNEMIIKAIDGKLPAYDKALEPFLSNNSEEYIKQELARLIAR